MMKKLLIVVVMTAMLFITQAWHSTVYAGELELGATATQGMSNTTSYLIGFEHKIGLISLSTLYRYGETNNDPTTDQGYMNLSYDRDFSLHWSVWIFNRSGFNHIRGINGENFFGFGPKYYIIKNDTTKLSLSVGYLHQLTNYEDEASESTHRMSYRPKFSYVNNGTEFRAIFFYQPSLSDPDDYITITKASVSMALNDTLAFKITVEDEYRSNSEGERHETLEYITLTMRF